MSRYKTTADFIHLYTDFADEERWEKLAKNLGFSLDVLESRAKEIG